MAYDKKADDEKRSAVRRKAYAEKRAAVHRKAYAEKRAAVRRGRDMALAFLGRRHREKKKNNS